MKRKILCGPDNPSYRHGMSKTPTYKIWTGMMQRCYNPKVRIYQWYGGRGIKVCDRWHDFVNFYLDMGERPDGLGLDRINNDLGYFKENCRWITHRENHSAIKGDLKDDMPGKKFGRLTVIHRVIKKPTHRYYLCRCDCGNEKISCGADLRRGKTLQCITCKRNSHRGWPLRSKRWISKHE